ncbi:terminase small subunit [Leuconostoc mesenteroides subsp. mesenteroides]|uniref:terminase small subunit n=1 Tax=Leuconostoc mesenteroides TaxID=1245 RepID=UPI0009FE1140|nr:terminase small subunit [Leuconostoc mesenteroides]ARN63730.1 terminase [Leuconostoc mesenteroides subsp. mesenteroides]MDV8928427.1 terminase small subunit [Leuconostoc mesenteroides]ORI89591.1 terminase small subunit [Leuconostoc mesenteroides subsp. mesenteroides]ORI93094.1 terminase small subunit [Leuconostoc mesenteroides subsp. mesenteroides]
MKLTPKQKKFADEYIKTGNATQSAIEAGYSKKYANTNAPKLLQNTTLKQYIEKCMAEIASNRVMSYTEAVELLTSIARGEEKETVVVGTPVGAETVEKEADLKTRISALKEIMKRYPGNDKLVEQQIRKLSAEADIAEANAREVTDNGTANEIRVIGFDRRAEEDERS